MTERDTSTGNKLTSALEQAQSPGADPGLLATNLRQLIAGLPEALATADRTTFIQLYHLSQLITEIVTDSLQPVEQNQQPADENSIAHT